MFCYKFNARVDYECEVISSGLYDMLLAWSLIANKYYIIQECPYGMPMQERDTNFIHVNPQVFHSYCLLSSIFLYYISVLTVSFSIVKTSSHCICW